MVVLFVMKLPYDPAIPLLCIYPKKKINLKRYMPPPTMLTAASFTVAKVWKQPKYPSTDKRINKLWYILLYSMEYYSPIKENEILPLTAM